MNSQSCYTLIKIGLAIRLLRNLTPKCTAAFVTKHYSMLTSGLTDARFTVSTAGLNNVSEMVKSLEDLDEKELIGGKASAEINSEMVYVEKIVFAESITKEVYTFPDRRFNSEILLSKPAKLLKIGAYEKLSEIAKSDVDAACRCILFGEATAAAFHILRATEDVLRQYYLHHRKRKRLTKPMWGPMTNELRAKKSKKPPDVVLNSLDLVRTSYRNPTQHPDATYDIQSAQDLMGVCIDLVNRMTSEL